MSQMSSQWVRKPCDGRGTTWPGCCRPRLTMPVMLRRDKTKEDAGVDGEIVDALFCLFNQGVPEEFPR